MVRSLVSSVLRSRNDSTFNQNFNFTHKTCIKFTMHGHASSRPIIVEFSNFPRTTENWNIYVIMRTPSGSKRLPYRNIATSREKFLPIVIKRPRISINYIRLCTSCYDPPTFASEILSMFQHTEFIKHPFASNKKKKKKKITGQIVIFNPRPPKKMSNDRKHQNYKYRKIIGML